MHTQQRNRTEAAWNARLLSGVAQITRNRLETFLSSHCFYFRFWLGSNSPPKCHGGDPEPSFPLRQSENGIESSGKCWGRASSSERRNRNVTPSRPRALTIKSHRASSARRPNEMQEVLIFRALNESAQNRVRSRPVLRA